MEAFAVVVAPVAKPEEWRAFCESVTGGERAEARGQLVQARMKAFQPA